MNTRRLVAAPGGVLVLALVGCLAGEAPATGEPFRGRYDVGLCIHGFGAETGSQFTPAVTSHNDSPSRFHHSTRPPSFQQSFTV